MDVDALSKKEFARLIDHTALKPDTTREQILELCGEAREHGFGTVCVAPCWVSLAVEKLAGSSSVVAAVVGFPHGNTLSSAKAFEAAELVKLGARELDMVLNIGAFKSGDKDTVRDDIHGVVTAARAAAKAIEAENPIVKVILETCFLTNSEIETACKLVVDAEADFVKTSTGFGSKGATVEHVQLMRRVVGDKFGVKASGGIRDYATAKTMLAAGANRLGCSASVQIMRERNTAN